VIVDKRHQEHEEEERRVLAGIVAARGCQALNTEQHLQG
jgi:hypothetical protein